MKKTFNFIAFVFLSLCFGLLILLCLTNEPFSKIGALVFSFFAIIYHIFNSLGNNTKK